MCRLFGFKSVLDSQVHSSLVHAENALAAQSMRHPDGWGVAYYRENVPHLIRSTDRAMDDHIFHKVSGVVSSKTVLAHIRKATQGELTLLNCHPFQYGNWVMAHNGNLKDFSKYSHELGKKISNKLKPFILGSTDSELVFYLLLSLIEKIHPLNDPTPDFNVIAHATQQWLEIITQYTGPLYGGKTPAPQESHLTFILTTGHTMLGFNGGQHLKFSTYKQQCPERETCSFFNQFCESAASSSQQINHLIFSSETHEGENIWKEMQLGELIGVDQNMQLQIQKLKVDFVNQPS